MMAGKNVQARYVATDFQDERKSTYNLLVRQSLQASHVLPRTPPTARTQKPQGPSGKRRQRDR